MVDDKACMAGDKTCMVGVKTGMVGGKTCMIGIGILLLIKLQVTQLSSLKRRPCTKVKVIEIIIILIIQISYIAR